MRTSSARAGSRLETGSSASSNCGQVRRVRQAATLCLSPLESVDVHWFDFPERPNLASKWRAFSRSSEGNRKSGKKGMSTEATTENIGEGGGSIRQLKILEDPGETGGAIEVIDHLALCGF